MIVKEVQALKMLNKYSNFIQNFMFRHQLFAGVEIFFDVFNATGIRKFMGELISMRSFDEIEISEEFFCTFNVGRMYQRLTRFHLDEKVVWMVTQALGMNRVHDCQENR
jgi:hypothetical protein